MGRQSQVKKIRRLSNQIRADHDLYRTHAPAIERATRHLLRRGARLQHLAPGMNLEYRVTRD